MQRSPRHGRMDTQPDRSSKRLVHVKHSSDGYCTEGRFVQNQNSQSRFAFWNGDHQALSPVVVR